MDNIDNMTIHLQDENGNDVEYEVLFTFDSPETKKSYIAYTDNSKDETGSTRVYASIYTPNQEPMQLEAIETDQEWAMVQSVLNKVQSAVTEGENK